ncbi:MAG TPA: hypothetical protein VH374_14340 [Polyangia bacterium]|nr:hypothetical protein [Polyangia bacterium]
MLLGVFGAASLAMVGGCSSRVMDDQPGVVDADSDTPALAEAGAGGDAGSDTQGLMDAATGSDASNGSGGAAVTMPDARADADGATAGDGAAAKGFVCTLVIGVSETYDWFTGGFETGAGIDNARWEALAPSQPGPSFIADWAEPSAPLWSMAKISPCTLRPTTPDRVIFVGVNWTYSTAAEWLTEYEAVLKTIQGKFPGVKEIVLDTLIRGPDNKSCGGPDATSEVVVQAFVDSAIEMAVAAHPGLVGAAPKLYVPSCDVFSGPGPHFTAAGIKVVAKVYSDHYVNSQ